MKLTFMGANKQVTGSRYCLEANGHSIMIDCGLFQEREYSSRNWLPCPISPKRIDKLLLTHAHIDHSGLIPRFVREGFRRSILATHPTVALCDVMLRDSARIQQEDASYKRRRHRREGRSGRYPEQPLYVEADVVHAMDQFEGVDYGEPIDLGHGMEVTFHDAGHILGSAILEIRVREHDRQRTIVFSGDIGLANKPLIRDPSFLERADYVVMESTYGDREHENGGDVPSQFERVIQRTLKRGGKVLIPTFAVERAQELMYYVGRLVHQDLIPDVRVYLDSPMAIDVTRVFQQFPEYLDDETTRLLQSDEPPLRFPGLRMVQTADESRRINERGGPAIIMASSGMCTAGRIKHHLRQSIGDPKATILFVGYQGKGTLGRQILDGQSPVRIHGQNYHVQAEIAKIEGFSGHAGRSGLLEWLGHIRDPRHVFLTHGEEDVSEAFARSVDAELGYPVSVPEFGEHVILN